MQSLKNLALKAMLVALPSTSADISPEFSPRSADFADTVMVSALLSGTSSLITLEPPRANIEDILADWAISSRLTKIRVVNSPGLVDQSLEIVPLSNEKSILLGPP